MKKNIYRFIVVVLVLTAMDDVLADNSNNVFYIDGNVGYASTNWLNSGLFPSIVVPNFSLNFDNFKNGRGGFTYGMDVGYLFNRCIGVEMGGMVLPQVSAKYIINTVPNITITGTDNISNWLVYSAGKFILPINKFDVFFKAGAAYRDVKFRGQDEHNNNLDLNGLSFIGGSGAEYHLNSSWSIAAQWMYVSGYTTVTHGVEVPAVNLLVVGLEFNL